LLVPFYWRKDAYAPETLTANVVQPGATYQVLAVESSKVRIPFHVAFMHIFDYNKDGRVHVAELNATFLQLEQQATLDLNTLRSQGIYSFNASVSSPASNSYHLAFPSAQAALKIGEQETIGISTDVDQDEYVSAEEFSRAGDAILRRMMTVYDGNQDGAVVLIIKAVPCACSSLLKTAGLSTVMMSRRSGAQRGQPSAQSHGIE
jgi:hypothetical protein